MVLKLHNILGMRGQSHPFVTPTFVRFNVALSAMLLLSTAALVAAQQQTAKPKRVDPVTATQENDAGTTGIEARAEEGRITDPRRS